MRVQFVLEQGMNWKQAIITTFLGNLIVLIPMTLNAHPGTRYGISFPVLVRASFGTLGSNVRALMCTLVACGWFGIQTWSSQGLLASDVSLEIVCRSERLHFRVAHRLQHVARPNRRNYDRRLFCFSEKAAHVSELYKPAGEYSYTKGFSVVALIALALSILPNLPGFLVTIKVLAPSSVAPLFFSRYHYAWFVGFAIAFVVYFLLRILNKRST